MKREYLLIALFFAITAGVFYLFYQLLVPFAAPLIWAGVFAILFYPLYQRLHPRVRSRTIASILMVLLIVVAIIGPIIYLFASLVNEAADAVAKVNEMYKSGELDRYLMFDFPWIDAAKERLSKYYDISQVDPDQMVKEAIDRVSSVIFSQTSNIITNGTRVVFYFGLMLFALYYFFKDGQNVIHHLKRLTPLPTEQVDKTFHLLRDVIQATMYGGIVVALVQGIMGGILFASVGIPSSVFWGALMGFLSVIPLVGAFLVYVPAGIILILGGSYIKGIVVIAVGTLVISQVDNVLRPYLISGRTQMHPLMLFFTILGGIALFGLLGIVVGPLIAAIFITMLKIFEFKLHPDNDESNPEIIADGD